MYELFDWKVKLGLLITVILFVASCITFIAAWNSPVPDDAMSAVTKYLNYRWFAACLIGFVSMASTTNSIYQKRLNMW
ncbi:MULTISPECIES: hypothetical protein [Aliivibrio]|uniref:Uncharacterized protein n=1 Tax=Aliivibrio finisterrensis TaxID=511998 RepID=A0A4Q5KL65_9GAMM|nr:MULTISPECIES: hypothetical protein [Aliivibrio]MDD9180657.1 hypothetical protein [Aliivibrio sp. A6]RYU47117.1 hypothetical protein ERW57_18670 [Aliivibrio finisterrensis]RYU48223.1 hypothetical protein ERW56_18835 [Aliivibrio finisterrensis]RYU52729.1 hypothetical protein ERW50_19015 [Aliivibrio finisterrensis]RYU59586.1 hypothetical protein ERW53_19865 [Aliivibrio finisterrensis]